jgi:hypothetical protein
VARAGRRIERDEILARATSEGRLLILVGDVRRPPATASHDLIVLAGVLPHLDGPEEALRTLSAARDRLKAGGTLIVDDIGPGELPWRDLPLSVDWEKELDGRPVTRRSQINRRESSVGLWVEYLTLTDAVRPDGTIARLPASYRLWYPTLAVLARLLDAAGLAVELTYGSHGLDPLDDKSDRRIVLARSVS